ncbi:Piwi domain-containing protein [Pseudomassariella vexata]|uniref:Piwi domain-domain-containing protein n=1 Tax=Pseudomassariella vexata TaxID=1141098 RepID=A0A1Y2DIV3_9PEZI|nr:Piwi domain-containing protein [Pseudomassariella vexata]ORY58755.1 Piwi domain-domain-containing protein [Pseudomassariella vexata]
MSTTELVGKRIDLPAEAFKTDKESTRFTKRPRFSKDGKPIRVQLNVFPVSSWPTQDIVQYDVNVSPNPKDSRALVKKVWESSPVQQFLQSSGGKWLYDGHKLAWSSRPIPRGEQRISVDLDKLAGKTRVGRDGVYYCHIRTSATIKMQYLRAYLNGQADWDKHVLECMNFLDHLMRQRPSERMISIKRNFYAEDSPRLTLDMYTHVRKGTYSAFRLSEFSGQGNSVGLGINVDVANTAFWNGGVSIAIVARFMLSPSNARNEKQAIPWGKMADALRPVQNMNPNSKQLVWSQSDAFKKLRRLCKLRFTVHHRGKMGNDKVYVIKNFVFDPKYGQRGADSLNVTFQKKNKDGTLEKPVTIFDHFKNTYNGRLQYPDLPLIETTRDGIFPMEVCKLIEWQRYSYKLDPEQTAEMIKIAVSRPAARTADIARGVASLAWNTDPYFKEFGLNVSPNMIISNARLLPSPEVHFAGSKVNPGVSGRWDLRGKRFLEGTKEPLKSWGFIGCGSNDGKALDQLNAFVSQFVRIYKGHGGRIEKNPFVTTYSFAKNYADMCSDGYRETGNHCKGEPQILFFVVSTKNQLVYERIKKNMDCRLCTVSQVLQADHVRKANAQYCSNVSMKVHSKLGSTVCKAVPVGNSSPSPFFPRPTIILGLDVSHGNPGSGGPSFAAMSMSTDKIAARYTASVQTNGYAVEIVDNLTMCDLLTPRFLKWWVAQNSAAIQHVILFRDGVSTGQFQHVIDFEVKQIKRIFAESGFPTPRFTVIVATKRHHLRVFPQPNTPTADKNGNALPGTLVERDATHPFSWDFYLVAHVALQGTARPTHYHVLLDEAGLSPEHLQRMIYMQSYQYCRSTTPVSIHPAVYYAHLASGRARAHEDVAASQKEVPSGKAGFPLGKAPSTLSSGRARNSAAPKLVPMQFKDANATNIQNINTRFWFV